MPETQYYIKVKRDGLEVEVGGDKEFVSKKSAELMQMYDNSQKVSTGVTKDFSSKIKKSATSALPKSNREKLEKLRDEGFFSEPKDSPQVTKEFDSRSWGKYKSSEVSSMLIGNAAGLGLRRVTLGKHHVGYTYP